MKKKAIILDLDNTIYPVSSIGENLFKELFSLIHSGGEFIGDFEEIKFQIMRTPFQKVAKDFSFSENLFNKSMELLKNLVYEAPMEPFDDYKEIIDIKLPKYLVTVGFKKLQQSKVRMLKIENDFEEIFIVDPTESALTKKAVFQNILNKKNYKAEDVMVIGDDPESEIKAAHELGIDSLIYDREGNFNQRISIRNFRELATRLK